jgi:hypothetical protein
MQLAPLKQEVKGYEVMEMGDGVMCSAYLLWWFGAVG